jgi:hypothetical protein
MFVYNGSLKCGDDDDDDDDEEYMRWGWLRFPVGSVDSEKRKSLKAGSNGAQVYVKTGHLTKKAMSLEKVQIKEG